MKLNNIYLNSILSKVFLIFLSFVNSIVINRYLGPDLRGEYALLLNISNILAVVLGFNITSSYPYFLRKYKDNILEKINNIVLFQTFSYIATLYFIYLYGSSPEVMILLTLSIIAQLSNQLDFISIVKNINKRNKIVTVSGIIQTLLLITMYFLTNENLYYIVGTLIFFHLFKIFMYMLFNKPKITLKLNSKLMTREVLKFSFFPMLTSLLTILNYNMDVIILKFFVENREIGLYSLAVTLASMLWIIPDAFKDVLFNKTAQNDSIDALKFSIKINLYFSFIVIIIFSIFGNGFISFIYGEEFSGSFLVSLILISGTIPMIFFKLISTLYQAVGKQHYSFYTLALSVLINFVFNVITIPFMGIIGAAISSVFSYLICGLIMLSTFKKLYNIRLKDFFIVNSNELNILKKKFNK